MRLLLTNEDIKRVLDMPASPRALQPAYRELAEGRAILRPQSQTYRPSDPPSMDLRH